MYFVIQVNARNEEIMLKKIKNIIDPNSYIDLFLPMRQRMKKINGEWTIYQEKWFPGYIFVETNKPEEIVRELKRVNGFTKLVGFGLNEKINYTPLSKKDEKIIKQLLDRENKKTVTPLSYIDIKEGNQIKIIDGPLLGIEGKILKINLHKRVALVEVEFLGKLINVQLGIDVISNL